MMKRIVWLSVFLSLVLVSASFAAITLIPANQAKPGQWLLLPEYSVSTYVNYASPLNALTGSNSLGLNTMGLFLGYGIIDKLDAAIIYQSANATGDGLKPLAALGAGGNFEISGTGLGLLVRYGVLQEKLDAKNMQVEGPCSLVINLGYISASSKVNTPTFGGGVIPATSTTTNYTEILGGLTISKTIATKMALPFVIPYASVNYSSDSYAASASNMTGLAIEVGAGIPLRENMTLVLGADSKTNTPTTGAGYSLTTYGLSLAWSIN